MPQQAPERLNQAAPPVAAEDRFARELRGFGVLGIAAIVIVLSGNLLFTPLSAVLVLVWAHLSHTPWRDIGFVRPNSWITTAVVGLGFGAAFKLLMKALVMPLLGAPPINQAFHYLAGNRALIPETLWLMIVVAGFGEETVFRGYMFERLGKLFGKSIAAKVAIVLGTSVFFGILHYPVQRLAGAEQATITGLVFGTIFAITGRLWIPIFAHAAFDVMAYALIYWNLETTVAHWVFR
ncbi:MAG TPA: type II CAAX endopeptidase family protein [Terriglobales bacterium]